MSRVHEDRHSIYVKAGGYIFRPVATEFNRGYLYMVDRPVQTAHKAGDSVKARHIPSSGIAKVGDEYWHGHGSYYDREAKIVSSERCWTPREST